MAILSTARSGCTGGTDCPATLCYSSDCPTRALKAFIEGYTVCLFWASIDDNDEPLDDGGYELAPEAMERIEQDCKAFLTDNYSDLLEYVERGGFPMPWEYAGYDFWLTRCGEGAGYWDRGLGELGDRLTAASERAGNCDAYVGDDGLVYLS